jgi:hypothetical protein
MAMENPPLVAEAIRIQCSIKQCGAGVLAREILPYRITAVNHARHNRQQRKSGMWV